MINSNSVLKIQEKAWSQTVNGAKDRKAEKQTQESQKPELRFKNAVIWPAKESDGELEQRVSIYGFNVQDVFINPKINNDIQLSSKQILELCMKDQITIKGKSEKHPFACTIVNKDVQTFSKTPYHESIKMNTCLVFHKLDARGNLIGYNYNKTGFNAHSWDCRTDQAMNLTPKDCVDLYEGKPVLKDGCIASLSKTKTLLSSISSKKYMTAKLNIKKDPKHIKNAQNQGTASIIESEGVKV